jgi:hypothetical protein
MGGDSIDKHNALQLPCSIAALGRWSFRLTANISPPTSPWAALLSGPSHQIDVLKFQLEVGHFLRQQLNNFQALVRVRRFPQPTITVNILLIYEPVHCRLPPASGFFRFLYQGT